MAVLAPLFLLCGCSLEHNNVAFDIAPDGQRVVFASANGDLHLLNLPTGTLEQLTATQSKESFPAFAPNGRRVVYAADVGMGQALFEYSFETRTSRRLTTTTGVSDALPRYSPDGSQLSFSRAHLRRRPSTSVAGWRWYRWDVYLVDADGARVRRRTVEESYSPNQSRFAPDGQRIVYSSDGARGQLEEELFEVGVTGAAPGRALEHPVGGVTRGAWATAPAISSDGSRVAFVSDRKVPFEYDIFIATPDLRSPVALGLTSTSRYNYSPVFAPDGTGLYFLAQTEGSWVPYMRYELWYVDVDGRNRRRVADSRLFSRPLAWKGTR